MDFVDRVMQIPEPYNFLVQVRYDDNNVYESYFAKMVMTSKYRVSMLNVIHTEARSKDEEMTDYHCYLGQAGVVGILVIKYTGEKILELGDMAGAYPDKEEVSEKL